MLLHGFAGTRRTWDGVIGALPSEHAPPLALDLRGHGAAATRRPITFEAVVADVLEAAPERFALCGYSMGGRIALHVALRAPERVVSLALIGASPGIEDRDERRRRAEADERLAARIAEAPIEEFATRWRGQPLFDGDPLDVDRRARADHLRNRPADLATALRGLGPGVMEPVWERLRTLAMPVLAVSGERDARYRAVAEAIAERTPRGHALVLPGGHAVHLESPEAVARALAANVQRADRRSRR